MKPAARGAALGMPALALLLSSCAGGSSEMRDAGRPERKSVLVGELLAIFPGFFYHGLGHRYAGNDERAEEIFSMQLYSLLPAALGGALYGIGVSEDAEAVEVAGLIGMGVGAIPFLGTWVYDMVYTPSEVKEHNRRQGSPLKKSDLPALSLIGPALWPHLCVGSAAAIAPISPPRRNFDLGLLDLGPDVSVFATEHFFNGLPEAHRAQGER